MCNEFELNKIELEMVSLDREVQNIEYCMSCTKDKTELEELKKKLNDVFNKLAELGKKWRELKND